MNDIEKQIVAENEILKLFHQDLDIYELELRLKELDGIDIEPEHIFSGGVYIRQITIPKGSIIIGKRHRYSTCNILLSGELSLYVGNGLPPQRVHGPLLFTSEPNVKKMAYCHKEAVFANIHPTDKTDLYEIENEFIIPEEEYQLENNGAKKCLGQQ